MDKEAMDGSGVTPMPTMTVLTVKPDAAGKLPRAKSGKVVPGNEEERCWEEWEVCAPAISKAGARSFIANGVAMGRIKKQADDKNAFCHPTLLDDETCLQRDVISQRLMTAGS